MAHQDHNHNPGLQHIVDYANDCISNSKILSNSYLAQLQDGSLEKQAFQASQQQFYYAVEFFSRPMAGLIAKIPDPARRIDILHNLVEEHGEFNSKSYHETTFRQFLRSIDCDPNQLDSLFLWPCIRAFNSCLITACVHDELEVGVACMGIIEYIFADISATIGKAVVANDWVSADNLVHYKLHAAIDKRHAQEFFEVIAPDWDDEQKQYYIKQGLELGCYIFKRLYEDMFEQAVTRSTD